MRELKRRGRWEQGKVTGRLGGEKNISDCNCQSVLPHQENGLHCRSRDTTAQYTRKRQKIQRAQQYYLIEQILSYRTQFFSIVTTISYTFSSVMNKSLHAMLKKSAWLSRIWIVFHFVVTTAETHHSPPHCAHIHFLVSKNLFSASVSESQWVPFFCMDKFHTFA